MSKENKKMLVRAFGWDADGYIISAGENAFLGRLLERATEIAGVGRLTKVKASKAGVSATTKSKLSGEPDAKNVDWRDAILHAAVAVADMLDAGMSGIRLDVSACCADWNRRQLGKVKQPDVKQEPAKEPEPDQEQQS